MSNRENESSSWNNPDTILDAVIIGTGFSGICMGIRLKEEGINSFVILEQENSVGGTWRDNIYPGAACDVQSHLYSFSFEPNPKWSKMFGKQKEILDYLNHCIDKYEIRDKIKFNSKVKSIFFEEKEGFWKIICEDGKLFFAKVVVSGTGGLSRPSLPKIKGIENFKGKLFHSARWDSFYDLQNKKIALIGTGASSIQILPAIIDKVKELNLFQRTPPWIIPKPDREISVTEQVWFKSFPIIQDLYRKYFYWSFEYRVVGLVLNPELMKSFQKNAEDFLEISVKDPILRKKLTPKYTIGCKRILMSNEYYEAVQKKNMNLITEKISEIKANSILTEDGNEHEIDTLILATGFETSDSVSPYEVIGKNGKNLNQIWSKNGSEAYLGTSIHDFPNYFMMTGPNTGLGHSSMVLMIEAQSQYILKCIKAIRSNHWKYMNVTLEAEYKYNLEIQRRLSTSIWTENCKSWYINRFGKNNTLWPGFTFEFMERTKDFVQSDYEILTRDGIQIKEENIFTLLTKMLK